MDIQDSIIGVLTASDAYSYFHDQGMRGEEYTEVRRSLADLRKTADEIKNLGRTMKGDIDEAISYVSGKPARFNSLGCLQSEGRFDALCMLFAERVSTAQRALSSFPD